MTLKIIVQYCIYYNLNQQKKIYSLFFLINTWAISFFREALNGVRFLPSASYLIRNMSYVTINFTGNTKKWV